MRRIDEIRLRLVEIDETADGLEEKIERRQRWVAVLESDGYTLSQAIRKHPFLKGLTPECVWSEIAKLQSQLAPLMAERVSIEDEKSVIESEERERVRQEALPKARKKLRECAEHLVALGRAMYEARSIVDETDGLIEQFRLPVVENAAMEMHSPYSALTLFIRDLVRKNILTGSEKFLDGVHWREV